MAAPSAEGGPAPLRILVVANLYPSVAHPAFGTFVGARVDALRRDGQRVSVAAITDDRVHQRIGVKYLRLVLRATGAALRARIARRPYQIVEAHIAFPTGLVAWPAARLGGGRLVLFCHGSDVTTLPWRSPARAALARWLFARADLVIANSRFTADIAEGRLGPLRRPAEVVSPGVAVPPAGPLPDLATRPVDHVVFVGRLAPGKGAEVLVEAMQRLQEAKVPARLTIVGDGPLRPSLEAQAANLGASVRFAGAVAPSQVAALLRAATVVAVPSTDDEGLGLVALEAMAQGALVVATAAGGLAETVRDGENGRVVAVQDPGALADALRQLLADATTPAGDRLRSGGRATATSHDLGRSVQATVTRFRALIMDLSD
ncbi:MAG: glycosyltransferase [Candidatus Limnocylindrales bacterium]